MNSSMPKWFVIGEQGGGVVRGQIARTLGAGSRLTADYFKNQQPGRVNDISHSISLSLSLSLTLSLTVIHSLSMSISLSLSLSICVPFVRVVTALLTLSCLLGFTPEIREDQFKCVLVPICCICSV